MKNLIYDDDKIINMVFAEQRLISMCAKRKNIEINEIMSLQKLFSNEQKLFTHTWGYKKKCETTLIKEKLFVQDVLIELLKIILNMKK